MGVVMEVATPLVVPETTHIEEEIAFNNDIDAGDDDSDSDAENDWTHDCPRC